MQGGGVSEPVLLDTCAVIWIANGDEITSGSRAKIEAAARTDVVNVSPISAWEIATLQYRNRLTLSMPVQTWFDRFIAASGVVLVAMPPKVLIDSASLPGNPPRDPADRILLATAREYGLTLVTRDSALLDYAGEGHASALRC